MLIATTYIGSSFPPEKRGTALGFVTLFPVFTGVNAPLGGKLIDNTFQSTLNKGYANLFIITTIIAFIGFIIFTIYLSGVIFWMNYQI